MKKYYINDYEVDYLDFKNALEDEINVYVEENYDDLLDEIYPEVEIGCCHFYPSEILKNCDPVAYRCGQSDEESYQLGEAENQLEDGDAFEINGIEFRIEDEEDEEED